MASKNLYGESITIDIVGDGFILNYPVPTGDGDAEYMNQARQVFMSPRKLIQKIKEVIDTVSAVADEK